MTSTVLPNSMMKKKEINPYKHSGVAVVNQSKVKVKKGLSGNYYCGRKGLYTCLYGSCDGVCGPTNGCNCPDCKKLDEVEGILPYKHRQSAKMNQSKVKVARGIEGNYYCGRYGLYQCSKGCDGRCGLNNGCNCPDCAELDKRENISPYNHGVYINHFGSE